MKSPVLIMTYDMLQNLIVGIQNMRGSSGSLEM